MHPWPCAAKPYKNKKPELNYIEVLTYIFGVRLVSPRTCIQAHCKIS